MDVIKIRDLEIYGHHGVMKEENVLGQKFLVSLALYTDTRAAGESDNLADSVNYAEVSYLVVILHVLDFIDTVFIDDTHELERLAGGTQNGTAER